MNQSRIWQSQIQHIFSNEICYPESYIETGTNIYPEDDFVISKKVTGETLSIFGDDTWDFKLYARASESACIRFSNWFTNNDILAIKIKQQAKQLMFCLLYKSEALYSVGSLNQSAVALKMLSIKAYKAKLSLDELNTNKIFYNELLETLLLSGTFSATNNLKTLFNRIFKVGEDNVGFNLIGSKQLMAFDKVINSLAKPNQTVIIPQRIYLELITGLEQLLLQFMDNSENLESLLTKSSLCPMYGRYVSFQQNHLSSKGVHIDKKHKWREWLSPTYEQAISDHNLNAWASLFNVTKLVYLSSTLNVVQQASKLLIHIFTGMRSSEVEFLPLNALKTKLFNDKEVYIFDGYTHKLSKGVKAASWITTKDASLPFNAAVKVANIIAKVSNTAILNEVQTPLFPSISMLPKGLRCNADKTTHARYERFPVAQSAANTLNKCLNTINSDLVLRGSDVEELENIDPHRDWSSDARFQIGATWPLATHQMRRSLAVYASNSGLVTLPSLKRQLKHITEEMTLYYSTNSTFARKFISTNNSETHISKVFSEEKLNTSVMDYLRNTVLSDSKLFGGYGKQIQTIKDDDNHLSYALIEAPRERTLEQFKNGEISYRETLLGGCMNNSPCSQGSFMSITGCLNCSSAIFNEKLSTSKIEKAITSVEFELSNSESESESSFEYIAASKQLTDLNRIYRDLNDK